MSKYLYTLPTVSPYMGLLRHDFTPYGSTKYDAFVKPRIDSFYHVSKPPAYVAAVPPLRK